MRLDELLSAMIESGATVEQIKAVVEASKAHETSREANKREQSAERMRRMRAKRKADAAEPVTLVTQVTPVTRNSVTSEPENQLDLIGVGSYNNIPPQKTTSSSTPRGQKSKASFIPDDWSPSEADRKYALGEGLSEAEIDKVAAEHLDYWRSVGGEKGRKRDWSATWRNRVRQIVERRSHGRPQARGSPAQRPKSMGSIALRMLRNIDEQYHHQQPEFAYSDFENPRRETDRAEQSLLAPPGSYRNRY